MSTQTSLRRLPTAFDREDSPVTLATPSCCCCCCCCVATVVTAIVHDSRDGYVKGQATDQAALGATVGFLALPMAALITFGIGSQSDFAGGPVVWLGLLVVFYIAAVVLVHRIGNAPSGALSGILRTAVIGLAFTVELGLVIATAGVIWIVTPLAIWGAWRLGSSQ